MSSYAPGSRQHFVQSHSREGDDDTVHAGRDCESEIHDRDVQEDNEDEVDGEEEVEEEAAELSVQREL